jgi:hypothetical protein
MCFNYKLSLNLVSLFQKKILKLQNFVSGVHHAIFSKNARILTVIFIGHRQLDNAFFLFTHYCIHRYTFCSSNLLFIQQLLNILYSFKEKKENRLILCPERNPVFDIINGNFN